jgi:hypothetical protein
MIQDVSDQLFQKFTDCMRRELETSAAPEAAQSPTVAEKSEDATPNPAPAPPPAPAPAQEDVLDVGALGAAAAGRAAKRTLARPGFWIAVVVLGLLMFWLFHC